MTLFKNNVMDSGRMHSSLFIGKRCCLFLTHQLPEIFVSIEMLYIDIDFHRYSPLNIYDCINSLSHRMFFLLVLLFRFISRHIGQTSYNPLKRRHPWTMNINQALSGKYMYIYILINTEPLTNYSLNIDYMR